MSFARKPLDRQCHMISLLWEGNIMMTLSEVWLLLQSRSRPSDVPEARQERQQGLAVSCLKGFQNVCKDSDAGGALQACMTPAL